MVMVDLSSCWRLFLSRARIRSLASLAVGASGRCGEGDVGRRTLVRAASHGVGGVWGTVARADAAPGRAVCLCRVYSSGRDAVVVVDGMLGLGFA